MSGDIPEFGNPDSLTCRWCARVKVRLGESLLCSDCDAPDHTAATWQRAEPA